MPKKNLKVYISKLNFDSIRTYSGLRGEKFIKLETETNNKIQVLEQDLAKAKYMQQSHIQAEIKKLTNLIAPEANLLIDKQSILHPSTTEISHLKRDDQIVQRIYEILNMDYVDKGLTLCIPVYRDAIVFYSSDDQIRGIIHICFECYKMMNENNLEFDVNLDIYPHLKELFLELGHKIES